MNQTVTFPNGGIQNFVGRWRAAQGETLAAAASPHPFLPTSPLPECTTGSANGDGGGGAMARRRPHSGATEEGEVGRPTMMLASMGEGSVCDSSEFGPPRPDLVEYAKIGSIPASTRAVSHRVAAEDS